MRLQCECAPSRGGQSDRQGCFLLVVVTITVLLFLHHELHLLLPRFRRLARLTFTLLKRHLAFKVAQTFAARQGHRLLFFFFLYPTALCLTPPDERLHFRRNTQCHRLCRLFQSSACSPSNHKKPTGTIHTLERGMGDAPKVA